MLHYSNTTSSELPRSGCVKPHPKDVADSTDDGLLETQTLPTSHASVDGCRRLSKPIHIRAFHESPSLPPVVLRPALVLLRSQIPTGVLLSDGLLASKTRIFRAKIGYLDQTYEPSNPPVLVASSQDDHTLYIVEKVHDQIHSLTPLAQWVTLALLEALPPARNVEPPARIADSVPSDDSPWWSSAAVSHQFIQQGTKRRRLEPQPVPHPLNATSDALRDNHSPIALPDPETAASSNGPSPVKAFTTIVSQYLEFLYLSKSSLAFFAKGPLSRARVSFLSASECTPQLQEYLDLLSSMVLDVPIMDKKYRESLPTHIANDLKDNQTQVSGTGAKRAKKASKKKPKLSREGMYRMEIDYLHNWLHSDDTPGGPGDMPTRLRAAQLREMLLQITVLLEIQAIASVMPQSTEAAGNESPIVGQEEPSTKITKSKRQKRRDFSLSLDLLVDRLCIWQSVDQTDETERSRPTSRGLESKSVSKDTSQQLKEFCTEVIIPLFASRVPDEAYKVSSKLGGPRQPSGVKKSKSRSSQASHRVAPGSQVVRKLLPDTYATSQAEANPKAPAAFSRQSSSALSLDVKNETTEKSLFDFPTRDFKRPLSRSGSINHTRRFSQREVDIGAALKPGDAKARKKPNVQQELKAAIETLKKPNRNQAVKDYFRSADQRQLAPSKLGKRSNVEVDATPTKRRAATLVEAVTPLAVKTMAPSPDQAIVPASVMKNVNVNGMTALEAVPSSIKAMSKHFTVTGEHTVLETPSRGPSKLSDPLGTLRHANTPQSVGGDIFKPDVSIYQSLGWDDDVDELS